MEFPPVDPSVLNHYRSYFENLYKLDGIPRHQGMVDQKQFRMRDDDVLITGFPKSGTHWLAEIVFLILNKGDLAKAEEKPLMQRISLLEINPANPASDSVKRLDALPSPRIFITHSPPRQAPEPKDKKFKTIVVMRNPKDAAVSFYFFHQILNFVRYDGSWSDFLSLFVNGEIIHGSWFDVVLEWWQKKDDPNICFLKYEDLSKDLHTWVGKLSSFLHAPLTSEQIQRIADACTFNKMKSSPMRNADSREVNDGQFMRKGVVGDWKNYFTVEQSEMFDQLYEQKMKNTGLHLEFE